MDFLFLSFLVVAATFITFGDVIKKLCGYHTAFDVISSGYFIATFAMTGTLGGLTIAVGAALLISIAIRVYRQFFGYEKLAVNGDEDLSVVVSAVATQGVKWTRSGAAALVKGGKVIPPEPLGLEWVKHPGQMFNS